MFDMENEKKYATFYRLTERDMEYLSRDDVKEDLITECHRIIDRDTQDIDDSYELFKPNEANIEAYNAWNKSRTYAHYLAERNARTYILDRWGLNLL